MQEIEDFKKRLHFAKSQRKQITNSKLMNENRWIFDRIVKVYDKSNKTQQQIIDNCKNKVNLFKISGNRSVSQHRLSKMSKTFAEGLEDSK